LQFFAQNRDGCSMKTLLNNSKTGLDFGPKLTSSLRCIDTLQHTLKHAQSRYIGFVDFIQNLVLKI